MVAFDLLYLNGCDMRKLPLIERKSHLKKLIAKDRDPVQRKFRGRRARDVPARLRGRARGRRFKSARQPLSSGRGNDWVRKPACSARRYRSLASR